MVQTDVECIDCKTTVPLTRFLDECTAYWRAIDAARWTCSSCNGRNEIRIESGAIWFGYTYGSGSAHFSPEKQQELPIDRCLADDDGLHVYVGDREWLIKPAS